MQFLLNLFILLVFKNKSIFINSYSCFEYSCEECKSEKYGDCTKCRENFTLLDGTCPCENPSCALCSTGLISWNACYLCKNGYHRILNDCYCDIENCKQCGKNECIKCKDSYYYSKTLGKCVKKKEDEIKCLDSNCQYCYTEGEGECYQCKTGYYLKNGHCNILERVDEYGRCSNDSSYYKEKSYCYIKCDGIECNIGPPSSDDQYFLCNSNNCLLCTYYFQLYVFTNCENKELCNIEGCMVCKTENECARCGRGYFYKNGQCKKCIQGCSICSTNNTCDYCLSGYQLNNKKKCIFNNNNFDFNVDFYKSQKEALIKNNYPKEYKSNGLNILDNGIDKNCYSIDDENVNCLKCNNKYTLKDNKCELTCLDINCHNCSYINNNEECIKCNYGYILNNGKCIYNYCYDKDCEKCLDDEENSCYKCQEGKKLIDGNCVEIENKCITQIPNCETCKNETKCYKCFNNYILDENNENCLNIDDLTMNDYITTIYIFLGIFLFVCLITIVISYCLKKKRAANLLNNNENRYIHNVNVLQTQNNVRLIPFNNSGNSGRNHLKEAKFEKEFDEYINLGAKYSQADECNICTKKEFPLGHFKCGCAFQICKECYIKCKLTSKLCPGCRKKI